MGTTFFLRRSGQSSHSEHRFAPREPAAVNFFEGLNEFVNFSFRDSFLIARQRCERGSAQIVPERVFAESFKG